MSTPAADRTGEPRGIRSTVGKVAAVATVLGIGLLWLYALTREPQQPPDLLDDPAVSAQAQRVCAANVEALDRLPRAFESSTAAERATVIEQANRQLRSMLDELGTIPVGSERDRRMVDEWLSDWSTYVGDRDDYVRRLGDDPDARFYVTEKEGRQITHPIDRFASVNRMDACATPEDVG
jgi:hypothetical protein